MSDKYYLGGEDGRTPIHTNSLEEWAQKFETENRRVALDEFSYFDENSKHRTIRISTVFLGLDHNWSVHGIGEPLLFETMVFATSIPEFDQTMDRCSTWEQVEAQHKAAVEQAEKLINTLNGEW